MNEIANIINQLEPQKSGNRAGARSAARFGDTGSITPGKSTGKAAPARKGGMTPEGRAPARACHETAMGRETHRGSSEESTTKKTKKTGLSPAGRRKLAEAMKRRWAAKRTGTQAKKQAA